ncbi:forespore capture DNA-binding protein RefZ [Thalassobacillus pellis]|uniref:forespore capture DNA-binding protein RefZ n=1 Tax=Thalassobacillus pellis TaxID=748008 RepID=UPI00195F8476|nr:forespore capture DNA-binding protein RefZ [Thalassobacillus pellis]MBM7554945.1 AcrR family transcriptional regulator [Thalassobacillus pellis]
MKKTTTRQKVMDVASRQFFLKGYNGTSVRDIAGQAAVNVSLISYYFTNKQGLLETLIVDYYEGYIQQLEQRTEDTACLEPIEQLCELIEAILHYKQERHQLTCLIQRELSLDNQFVREMLVTYLSKENHLLYNLFRDAVLHIAADNKEIKFLYLQFKGMLQSPYAMPNDWKDFVTFDQSHHYFAKQYSKTVQRWVKMMCAQPLMSV